MFFEGAPRLLAFGATIPHLKEGDPERRSIEAYPGILARTLIDRRSYKNDTRKQIPLVMVRAGSHTEHGALRFS